VLDLNWVAKNFDTVVARLSARSGTLDLSRFKELFAQRKALFVELETNQAKKNKAQELMKTDASKRAELGPEMKALGQVIKDHGGSAQGDRGRDRS
jgi:seryl-tRNA synthetase